MRFILYTLGFLLLFSSICTQSSIGFKSKSLTINTEKKTTTTDSSPISIPVRASGPEVEEDCGNGIKCIPYWQCENNVVNIEEGPACVGSLDVCCGSGTKTNNNTAPDPIPPPKPPKGCGYRNFNGIGVRITGGRDNETEIGEFPWMTALIQYDISPDNKPLNNYQCGASLIHPSIVLTAAHCVHNIPPQSLKVRVGEWDTQTTAEPLPHQDRNIIDIVIHPDFQNESLRNDIALLFLEIPVEIAENVNTVCLPPPEEIFDFERCFATGWGKDQFGRDGKYQVILKKIDLPVIPPNTCQELLRSTRLSQHFELHKSFICAGGEDGKDTCKGDGGSPLVCPIKTDPNRYYQAGIVAWGIGCGSHNVPGVYASVTNFREWIDSIVKSKGISLSSYTP